MARFLVIWDGDCQFCARVIGLLKRKASSQIAFKTYQEVGNGLDAIGLTVEDVQEAMWLTEPGTGRSWRGYFAFEEVVMRSPGLRLVRFAFLMPGASKLGPKIYGRIASNRSQLGCGNVCHIR